MSFEGAGQAVAGEYSRFCFLGPAVEAEPPRVENQKAVGQVEDLFHLMGQNEYGDAPGIERSAYLGDFHYRFHVQVGEGLVQDKAFRLHRQDACDSQPSAFAAGECFGSPVFFSGKVGPVQGFSRPSLDFFRPKAQVDWPEGHVFGDALAEDLGVAVLEYEADGFSELPAAGFRIFSAKKYAPLAGLGESGQMPGQEGFARAVAAREDDKFSVLKPEVDAGQAFTAVGEAVPQVLEKEELSPGGMERMPALSLGARRVARRLFTRSPGMKGKSPAASVRSQFESRTALSRSSPRP